MGVIKMNALIRFNRHISKLFFISLAAMMLLMMATPSHAAVSVFLSAGNTCAGGTTVNFSTSGSTVQVSLCVTNTGEPFGLCGQSSKLQSANAGENGRFNLTARTLGASYADPNNTAIPFPFAVNNSPPTSDLGGTSTTGAPVAPAASQLLATFDLSPQASATNASYVLSTSSDSILSVDTDNTCNNPTDLAIPASITMNLVAPTFTVTPSAGANGSITPNTAQVINSGSTTMFTVTPNAGFTAAVGGSCGGTLVGTTYTTSAITANCTVSATFTANLALTAVQSRKTHAAAGTFDIAIDTVPLVTGNVTTEPRIIGAGHTIVFQFNQAITATGTLAVTDALGNTISTANAVISGNNVVVTITGIADVRARIALTGVTAATGMINAVASVGFLYGDVSNNRSVNASDIVSTRNRNGQATTNANFRYDVDLSGVVDATDAAAVKAKSVSGL
jgi:hypothetical protein